MVERTGQGGGGKHVSMTQTRSKSIHRGFHRVGAVLAGLVILLVAITTANGGLGATSWIAGLGIALAVAVTLYALSRAIGWIIAGFAGGLR